MDRNSIENITRGEFQQLTTPHSKKESFTVIRRPATEDEIDRIGRQIVRRLLEAGVTEPL